VELSVVTPDGGCIAVGVGYRKAHQSDWLSAVGTPCTEVLPDHFFDDPAAIEPLARHARLAFHDVGLSLGTEGPLDSIAKLRLERIRELASAARPLLFSDHLAATRSPSGLDIGHLFPICFTADTLARIADKVAFVREHLQLPVALENLAAPFVLPGSTMDEADFCWALFERAGTGLVLDLTNLLYNCRNRGLEPFAELARYPLQAVWQVHLSGGSRDRDGFWHDTHSSPVESDSYRMLEWLVERVDPPIIIIERDQALPPLSSLIGEAQEAERRRQRARDRARGSAGVTTHDRGQEGPP
jgi:uncharacterized protein (UPF0276 family)